jgi:hypothetical protein
MAIVSISEIMPSSFLISLAELTSSSAYLFPEFKKPITRRTNPLHCVIISRKKQSQNGFRNQDIAGESY